MITLNHLTNTQMKVTGVLISAHIELDIPNVLMVKTDNFGTDNWVSYRNLTISEAIKLTKQLSLPLRGFTLLLEAYK